MPTTFARGSLALTAILSLAAIAVAADAPSLQKLSDHVYAYVDTKGAGPGNAFGANAGVVIGRDAVLVVDTLMSAKEAEHFLADIHKVTNKPVKYVVNTHHHLDHAWGNGPFAAQGAVIIGHENTRRDLPQTAERLAHPEASGMDPNAFAGTTLVAPTVCFNDKATVDLGDLTVELRYPGPTHTPGSILVAIPQDKLLFVGDILFAHYHPYLAEGDFPNWTKVLDELAQSDATKIVPGHGPLADKSDFAEMKTYLIEFDRLARELCAGKQADDAPALMAELLEKLPKQDRPELAGIIEKNLRVRYLPQPGEKK
jgi:cyclase